MSNLVSSNNDSFEWSLLGYIVIIFPKEKLIDCLDTNAVLGSYLGDICLHIDLYTLERWAGPR